MLRSHTCNDISPELTDQQVILAGWVASRRDHGGLIFVDLRDRYGLTQVVTDPALSGDAHALFEQLRPEWVVAVTGSVRARPAGQENATLATGGVELLVTEARVLSQSATPPFPIDDSPPPGETTRLTHRYLDLRRPQMQRNILLRHRLLQATRAFFYEREFVEIETPMLIKGTPEGSREYLVPSRLHAGKVYVLPQSPQQLKQLTQVAGFDRYMQITRCFRDEDFRSDRQPEFTQMDLEMSFCEVEDVMTVSEQALQQITRQLRPDVRVPDAFPRLTYAQAMNRYGTDKPDLRFGVELADISAAVTDCGFGIFASAVEAGGCVKVLATPAGTELTRKDIDELTQLAQTHGARGLAWIRVTDSGYEGVPAGKLGDELCRQIADEAGAQPGSTLLFSAGDWRTSCLALGAVRSWLGARAGLADPAAFAFCWITDFPLFERDADGRLSAAHHPFTQPADPDGFADNPEAALAEAYDVVLNGYEIGGGSLRIHDAALQARVFDVLGIAAAEQQARFGHLLQAFSYGVPPHGGIAWGLDRIAMLLAGERSITDVIAFPKTRSAVDLMLGAPSTPDTNTLTELGVRLVES